MTYDEARDCWKSASRRARDALRRLVADRRRRGHPRRSANASRWKLTLMTGPRGRAGGIIVLTAKGPRMPDRRDKRDLEPEEASVGQLPPWGNEAEGAL
jgi:hypothetical protein